MIIGNSKSFHLGAQSTFNLGFALEASELIASPIFIVGLTRVERCGARGRVHDVREVVAIELGNRLAFSSCTCAARSSGLNLDPRLRVVSGEVVDNLEVVKVVAPIVERCEQ